MKEGDDKGGAEYLSFANHWQAWLERGEFIMAFYWKAKSVTIHYHVGRFDKMLVISRFGIFVE